MYPDCGTNEFLSSLFQPPFRSSHSSDSETANLVVKNFLNEIFETVSECILENSSGEADDLLFPYE